MRRGCGRAPTRGRGAGDGQASARLNGASGTIGEYDEDADRYVVYLDAGGTARARAANVARLEDERRLARALERAERMEDAFLSLSLDEESAVRDALLPRASPDSVVSPDEECGAAVGGEGGGVLV